MRENTVICMRPYIHTYIHTYIIIRGGFRLSARGNYIMGFGAETQRGPQAKPLVRGLEVSWHFLV